MAFKFQPIALGLTAIALAFGADAVVKNQGYLPFADEPINYRSQKLADPITKLQKRLDCGSAVLHYDARHGYLKAVLDELRIPVSSQVLVFSKTSFQFQQIGPATPRALYYNDDVYAGRVHDGKFLEFISFDPMQGAVFYVLDDHQTEHPLFERAAVDCVQCHVAPATRNVPGVFMRSVFTRATGYPAAGTRTFVTGQESPISQRWGGWYVTAAGGAERSMANAIVSDPKNPEQVTSLAARFDRADYLTASSDVVALMVLTHQTQMHNLITQTNYLTRIALCDETNNKAAQPASARYERTAEQLVRYLLFTNEVPLESPIKGASGFAEEFAARGPRDSHGRSLRDFDLNSRMFKYPCSYLIYSEDFDALPLPAKDYVYRRLFEVLSGQDQSPEFSSLTGEERRAILEILVATKAGLPAEWSEFVRKTSDHVRTSQVRANDNPQQ